MGGSFSEYETRPKTNVQTNIRRAESVIDLPFQVEFQVPFVAVGLSFLFQFTLFLGDG